MVKARKYVVKNIFDGVPKRSDYEVVEVELPPLQNGDILLKTEWVSVDPYLRAYNRMNKVPYDQFSFQVAIVQETKDPNYPVGTRVVTHNGWCDYSIVRESKEKSDGNMPKVVLYKVPDFKGLSPSLGVGALGMPGATAYFGFLEICQPKAGETVVITGAAGAVGSLVGQIAKIKGCKVIGFAGSDEKVAWLEKELGFDKALNYKAVDAQTALRAAAPDGVDCYFDNVGGELSSIIIGQMNVHGRVSVCGSISSYNADPSKMPKATILQPSLVFKQIKIEGFLVWRWGDRWPVAFEQLAKWIMAGQLKTPEHVTEGFDKLFDALIGMLAGENAGKAVVKIYFAYFAFAGSHLINVVKARKYVVKNIFDGVPKRSDYEVVEVELPPLQDGDILVKAEWVSVDPYLRAYNRRITVPYDQFSFQVGIVQETKDPKYCVGSRVVTHNGWCDYSIVRESKEKTDGRMPKVILYKLPEFKGLSPSLGVGALGMPGATAYFGFLEICQPKAGETVVITGAAGAVGSLVGQIAKIIGCKVIGFAGSDEKVAWLEKELGFDKALNYKTVDAHTALRAAAPDGVDCYFETSAVN